MRKNTGLVPRWLDRSDPIESVSSMLSQEFNAS
jgi:hypothetical protein